MDLLTLFCNICFCKTKSLINIFSENEKIKSVLLSLIGNPEINENMIYLCSSCCEELTRINEFRETCCKSVLHFRKQYFQLMRELESENDPDVINKLKFFIEKHPLMVIDNEENNTDNFTVSDKQKIKTEPQELVEEISDTERVSREQEIEQIFIKEEVEDECNEYKCDPDVNREDDEMKEVVDSSNHDDIRNDEALVKDTKDDSEDIKHHKAARSESDKEFECDDDDSEGRDMKQKRYLHACEYCIKKFPTKRTLDSHKRIHTSDVGYKCSICGRCFVQKFDLDRHVRTHTGEKPYSCNICGRTFTQKYNLQIHKRTHTGEKPFKCNTCDRTFTEKASLIKHIRIHTGEKPFSCNTCGVKFTQKCSLDRHIRIHIERPSYKCDLCNRKFSEKMYLDRHKCMRAITTYKCSTCDATFTQKSDLKNHERLHTGEAPYKCITCGLIFMQKNYLTKHARTHTGEKPFKCCTCDQTFTLKSSMQKHSRIHTGERPFKCITCGQTFREKSVLDRHTRIHTGEKPHICNTCGRAFRLLHHLRDHYNTHSTDRKIDIKSEEILGSEHNEEDAHWSPEITEIDIEKRCKSEPESD